MVEKDQQFSSALKYQGVFSMKDFYQFCYDWLTEQTQVDVAEEEYSEKIKPTGKDIDISWKGERKFTDYFKEEIKVSYRILGLKEVEISQGDKKFKSNSGQVKVSVKGTLVKDYDSKFEGTATRKFMRSIYEKWVIPSRVKQFEDKIISDSDEFLSQAKAFLDLEGRK